MHKGFFRSLPCYRFKPEYFLCQGYENRCSPWCIGYHLFSADEGSPEYLQLLFYNLLILLVLSCRLIFFPLFSIAGKEKVSVLSRNSQSCLHLVVGLAEIDLWVSQVESVSTHVIKFLTLAVVFTEYSLRGFPILYLKTSGE